MYTKRIVTYIVPVAYLISLIVIYHITFPSFSVVIQDPNSILLKHYVNDGFVGSLRHTIYIKNPTSRKVMDGTLFVPVIRNETARHYVILYNISSSMGQPTILNDDSGNKYVCWRNIVIDEKQTFAIEMNYYLISFSTRYIINSSLIVDYDTSSNLYKKYTRPEELIQSNDPQIILTMENITKNESNVHEKVSKIYNFVTSHIRYAKQDNENGALWALENGVGDCSEYSYLFVALCRAAGIPARIQAGFAFRTLGEILEDGHMWAEYYLENYGWIPVDATWRLFDALDQRHFSAIQSIPEPIPYANYIFNNTLGPKPVDEQTVQLQSVSPSVLKEEHLIENTLTTIQKIEQTGFALFLAKVLGTTVIFPLEAEKSEKTVLESQIKLQNAVDFWEVSPQLAKSDAAEALESSEEALQCIWTLIAKTFTIYISILSLVIVVTFVFLRRQQTK
jgi:hypothetical protein